MPRKINDDSSSVTWKDKIENDEGVDFYSQCVVNEFLLSIGDFVYVSNPDQPINVKQNDVVKITQLYEIIDPLSLDYKHQAVVESYRRPLALPAELTSQFPDLDFNREVIFDPVVFSFSLPLHAVRGKCNVMFSEPNKSVSDAMTDLTGIRNKRNLYICRYKIVNRNGKLSLVAVNDHQRTTPPKLTVSPIKIVNKNSVQKVSKSSQNELENLFSESESEIEVDDSPAKVYKSSDGHNNLFGARRNLNTSLNDAADNVLVGSIMVTPHHKDDLKMTIKVTRKENFTSEKSNTPNTPLKAIQHNNNELDNLSKRQSATKRRIRPGSPMPTSPTYTPTKTPKRTKTPRKCRDPYGTPNQENRIIGTPKSILKSLSVRLERTTVTPSRRSISFALKENPHHKTTLPSTEENVDVSSPSSTKSSLRPPSSTKSSLRRSTRRSSTHRMSLAESPLDISFMNLEDSSNTLETPEKQSRKTPSKTPKKSTSKTIQQTPSKTPKTTPKKTANRTTRPGRSLDLSFDDSFESLEPLDETLDDTLETPPKKARKTPSKTPKKTPSRTPKRTPSTRISAMEPVIGERKTPIRKDRSEVQLAKESLHVSAVPKTLPCRENEFRDAYKFIEGKILDESGGCMYVSGVPGTGKTATITEVIRSLQLEVKRKKIPQFEFIEINGMRLTEPRQAYVQIYQQLTGTKVTSEQAHSLLDKRFTTPNLHRKTTVLLVDELDILCNRRQDVIYNLLDWPTRKAARLVVVTIANTMDLPERLLMGRVTSRLGLTRLTFQPYTHKQLQEVVQARLIGTNIFENDAVQLVARKVASISGDCRRALDICRRATEIAESDCSGKKVMVSMLHVQKAFNEMITNPKVLAIKGCSKYEKLFLQAVEAEVVRTGVDETVLSQVYLQLESICALNGVSVPEPGIALRISSRLGSSRLLICEHSSASIHQKIMLNVTSDDIYYALHVNNDE